MSDQTIYPPDLDDLLHEKSEQVKAEINCIQIGKIDSYSKTSQSAKVKIQVKRRIRGGVIREYPVLLDVPVFVIQGGGGFLEMPFAVGDYCLVLFNDRNINTWWKTANVTEPPTKRKHSIADGFALVGINPETKVLTLDGENVNLWGPGAANKITITPDGDIEIGASGSPAAARVDDTTVSDSSTDSAFWTFMSAFFGIVTGAPIPEPGNGSPSAFQAALSAAIGVAGGTPSSQAGKIDSGSGKVVVE